MGNSYGEQSDYLDELASCGDWIVSKYRQGIYQFEVLKMYSGYFDDDFEMIADYVKREIGIDVTYSNGEVTIIKS